MPTSQGLSATDPDRLDGGVFADTVPLDPTEEVARGPVTGHARVAVPDRRGEKFEETASSVVAGGRDRGRRDRRGS
jgi:hypothetical protein